MKSGLHSDASTDRNLKKSKIHNVTVIWCVIIHNYLKHVAVLYISLQPKIWSSDRPKNNEGTGIDWKFTYIQADGVLGMNNADIIVMQRSFYVKF
jgi:hypothetical protein